MPRGLSPQSELSVPVIHMPAPIAHFGSMEMMKIVVRVIPPVIVVPIIMLAAPRHRPVVPEARIVMPIYPAVEAPPAAIPRPRANENAIAEPCRTVIPVWRAVIRRIVVIAIRTNRRRPNVHRQPDLRFCPGSRQKYRRNHRSHHCSVSHARNLSYGLNPSPVGLAQALKRCAGSEIGCLASAGPAHRC